MAVVGGNQRRTLRVLVTLGVQGISWSIAQPKVEANNFELKPALISMVQQSQFRGTPLEDPNLHLSVFLKVCDTLNLNRVSTDVIRLFLFPFSLRDKVRVWLHLLPSGCIKTWDELTKVFLAKFFPSSLRNQITTFSQKEEWDSLWSLGVIQGSFMIMPSPWSSKMDDCATFYNGVTQPLRPSIAVAVGGTLMNKTIDEAYNLIE